MKLLLSICFVLSLSLPTLQAQDSVYFRANEWRNQINGYYSADKANFPKKGAILFVGSSSIRMWRGIEDYFPEHRILSRGFGGARMSDVLYHMQRLVIDYRPAQIVLYAGENDLANNITPDALLNDIRCFVRMAELHLPGVPILILSVKPSPYSAKIIQHQRRANMLMYELCQHHNHLTFVDISSLMFDPQGNFKDELYGDDKLHVNSAAYRLWAQVITPHLLSNGSENY